MTEPQRSALANDVSLLIAEPARDAAELPPLENGRRRLAPHELGHRHRRHGGLAFDQGRLGAALEHYHSSLAATAEATDHESLRERAAVHCRLSRALSHVNRPQDSRTHLRDGEEILARLEDPDPALPVLRDITTAWIAIHGDHERDAIEPARRARSEAQQHAWETTLADASQCLGIALSVAGRHDEAIDRLLEAPGYSSARKLVLLK
jgi:hypothetical protein